MLISCSKFKTATFNGKTFILSNPSKKVVGKRVIKSTSLTPVLREGSLTKTLSKNDTEKEGSLFRVALRKKTLYRINLSYQLRRCSSLTLAK